MTNNSDIYENEIEKYDKTLLPIILIDRTRSKEGQIHNIFWATDNYKQMGKGYGEWDEISEKTITGKNGLLLRPRVDKSKAEQEHRSRDKAEVFTDAWICNKQNNLIDAAWFGLDESPFNTEVENGWITKPSKIQFTEDRTWQDYVKDTRLEMACGEAPYLVSRYNVITGEDIPVKDRIGLLDRKLRIICENASDKKDWLKWVQVAYQNIYGFEWQGDNLILAREAMIYSFFDYFVMMFGSMPTQAQTRKIAEIVSWNLWQMDGLKCVVPNSCHDDVREEGSLFGEVTKIITKCEGCENDELYKHNGIYSIIMDWDKKKPVRFVDLIKNSLCNIIPH